MIMVIYPMSWAVIMENYGNNYGNYPHKLGYKPYKYGELHWKCTPKGTKITFRRPGDILST